MKRFIFQWVEKKIPTAWSMFFLKSFFLFEQWLQQTALQRSGFWRHYRMPLGILFLAALLSERFLLGFFLLFLGWACWWVIFSKFTLNKVYHALDLCVKKNIDFLSSLEDSQRSIANRVGAFKVLNVRWLERFFLKSLKDTNIEMPFFKRAILVRWLGVYWYLPYSLKRETSKISLAGGEKVMGGVNTPGSKDLPFQYKVSVLLYYILPTLFLGYLLSHLYLVLPVFRASLIEFLPFNVSWLINVKKTTPTVSEMLSIFAVTLLFWVHFILPVVQKQMEMLLVVVWKAYAWSYQKIGRQKEQRRWIRWCTYLFKEHEKRKKFEKLRKKRLSAPALKSPVLRLGSGVPKSAIYYSGFLKVHWLILCALCFLLFFDAALEQKLIFWLQSHMDFTFLGTLPAIPFWGHVYNDVKLEGLFSYLDTIKVILQAALYWDIKLSYIVSCIGVLCMFFFLLESVYYYRVDAYRNLLSSNNNAERYTFLLLWEPWEKKPLRWNVSYFLLTSSLLGALCLGYTQSVFNHNANIWLMWMLASPIGSIVLNYLLQALAHAIFYFLITICCGFVKSLSSPREAYHRIGVLWIVYKNDVISLTIKTLHYIKNAKQKVVDALSQTITIYREDWETSTSGKIDSKAQKVWLNVLVENNALQKKMDGMEEKSISAVTDRDNGSRECAEPLKKVRRL